MLSADRPDYNGPALCDRERQPVSFAQPGALCDALWDTNRQAVAPLCQLCRSVFHGFALCIYLDCTTFDAPATLFPKGQGFRNLPGQTGTFYLALTTAK